MRLEVILFGSAKRTKTGDTTQPEASVGDFLDWFAAWKQGAKATEITVRSI